MHQPQPPKIVPPKNTIKTPPGAHFVRSDRISSLTSHQSSAAIKNSPQLNPSNFPEIYHFVCIHLSRIPRAVMKVLISIAEQKRRAFLQDTERESAARFVSHSTPPATKSSIIKLKCKSQAREEKRKRISALSSGREEKDYVGHKSELNFSSLCSLSVLVLVLSRDQSRVVCI